MIRNWQFGAFISVKRKSLNLLQDELAKKVGVSQSTIGMIETGKRLPSPEMMRKLAKSLGVSYISLLMKAGYLTDDEVSEWQAEGGRASGK